MIERLLRCIDVDENGCWLWQGSTLFDGYGLIRTGGRGSKQVSAHRAAFEILKSPIPAGLDIDHLCRIRHCVNPDHLEPVTHRENLLRSPLTNAGKTHCKNGHEFTPENTLRSGTRRHCRACSVASSSRYRAKRKAQREG